MKKLLHVLAMNHMDPVWKRGWRRGYEHDGFLVRPYSDLEESQVAAWLDLCEHGGARYILEQTITLRHYLERNPDDRARVARLLREGALEVLGCGETTVDTNLIEGESIVRSHLAAIQWMQGEFGLRPRIGAAPDTFGLSAQLPQIFRLLGYETLQLWCRVLPDARPFLRGLDGTLILIRDPLGDRRHPAVHAVQTAIRPPSDVCRGEGHPAEDWTGLDNSVVSGRPAELLPVLARLASKAGDEHLLVLQSEELLPSPKLLSTLSSWAESAGYTTRFSTLAELTEKFFAAELRALRENQVPADQIDPRVEGNPVCTGCYLSRVRLKQLGRRAEHLLSAAERFALFALRRGAPYPAEKLDRLWRQLALLHFHDAITGSHVDAVQTELLDLVRELLRDAAAVRRRAIRHLAALDASPYPDAHLVFNPLDWDLAAWPVRATFAVDAAPTATGLACVGPDGRERPLSDLVVHPRADGGFFVEGTFVPSRLPACGFTTLQLRPLAAPPPTPRTVENEFYRITHDSHGIAAIHDRRSGALVCPAGAGDLILEEDVGSPWETLAEPFSVYNLTRGQAWTRVPGDNQRAPGLSGVGKARCAVESLPGGVRLLFSGEGNRARTGDRHRDWQIAWRQEITLWDGVDGIFFHTEIDWSTADARVYVQFPLPFPSPTGEADYEIPFGALRRAAYTPRFGYHTYPNGDWPALNFVSVPSPDGARRLTLLNRGLSAHRVADGALRLGLVRSSAQPVFLNQISATPESGKHVFDYALYASSGDLEASDAARRGRQFNAEFVVEPAPLASSPGSGPRAPEKSYWSCSDRGLIASAIKRAHDGQGTVLRLYETYGRERRLDLPAAAALDLTEAPAPGISPAQWRPFEIKTLRLP